MHRVLHHVEAQLVGGAVGHAAADAAAGHPEAVGLRVVIASLAAAQGRVGLHHRGASEFASPDHQGVVEQAALLQVEHQRGAGLIGGRRVAAHVAHHIGMGVPALVVQVHEPDPTLDHPSGQQAGPREGRLVGIAPVHLEGLRRFGAQVHEFRGRGLEPEGHFVRGDAGGDLRVAHHAEALAVQVGHQVERVALQAGIDARGVVHVEDGRALIAQADAGVDRRQEPARPERGPAAEAASGAHDHEGGEVLGFGPETVEHPGTEAGASGLREAGIEEDLGRGVVELVGAHRAHQADVVHDFGQMRQHFGDLGARLAVAGELEAGAHHGRIGPDEGIALTPDDRRRQGATLEFGQLGLGVEELQLARGAAHEEVDHPFGRALELRGSWGQRRRTRQGCRRETMPQAVGQQAGQGDLAQADPAVAEEVPSADVVRGKFEGIHGGNGFSPW